MADATHRRIHAQPFFTNLLSSSVVFRPSFFVLVVGILSCTVTGCGAAATQFEPVPTGTHALEPQAAERDVCQPYRAVAFTERHDDGSSASREIRCEQGELVWAESSGPRLVDVETGEVNVETGVPEHEGFYESGSLGPTDADAVWAALSDNQWNQWQDCEGEALGSSWRVSAEMDGHALRVECGGVLPDAWTRVLRIVESVLPQNSTQEEGELWQFNGEYWRDELK